MEQRFAWLNSILLCLIITFYLISIKLCNLFIILYCLNWVVWFIKYPKNFKWPNPFSFLVILPYLIGILTLFYSEDVKEATFSIEKKLSLILFPIMISMSKNLTQGEKSKIFKLGLGTLLAVTFFYLSFAGYKWVVYGINKFYWKDLTEPLDFHPSYLSLYINLFIYWLGLELIQNWDSWRRGRIIWVLLTLGYFLFVQVLLSSKVQLVISFVCLGIILFRIVSRSSLKWKLLLLISTLTMVLILSTFWKKAPLERFGHISRIEYKLDAPVETFNELTIRFALIECAWMVVKENLVFGVGIGDVRKELDKVYRKVDYKFGYLDNQDPHNQYLQIAIGSGIVGLLIFLISFLVPLYFSILANDKFYIFFSVLFLFSFLFESVLERHNGIILYSFFNSLLLFGNKSFLATTNESSK